MADEETPKGEEEKTFTADEVQALLAQETEGLKAKVDELLGETKAARAKAREAAEKAAKEAEERARASGDVEALEKSWQEKYATTKDELTEQLSGRDKIISNLTAGTEAARIASELAIKGSEEIVQEWVAKRLGVEFVEGQAKVYVKDAAGQRSAQSIEDLKKEVLSVSALKPLLDGGRATGPGGVNAARGAGRASTVGSMSGSRSERQAAIRARFPNLDS